MTVACVLRSGGVYDAEDVERLRNGVAAHLGEHDFVCLSDVEVPCERIPLGHGWPGWWSKIEAFLLPPPVLYIDLDTIIVGDIADIAAQAEVWQFTMLRDFNVEKGLGSGLMAWGVPMETLYEKFVEDPAGWMQKCRAGDQQFIELNVNARGVVRWQDALPGQVVSYKTNRVAQQGVPAGARMVCFHGKPKPRDIGWRL